MPSPRAPESPPDRGCAEARLPVPAAAELQDHLLIAGHDLERLRVLLEQACDSLVAGFHGARDRLLAPDGQTPAGRAAALRHLGTAVLAMQFQDMATQLLAHTGQRLRHCADRLARDAFGDDDESAEAAVTAAPPRPNPVTQSEMDAGSVELF